MNANDIIELRKRLKLTQQKFADLIGVNRRTIANYEQGRIIPKANQLLIQGMIDQNSNTTNNPNVHLDNQLDFFKDNSTKNDTINNQEKIELKYISILEEEKFRLNDKIIFLEKEIFKLKNTTPQIRNENKKLREENSNLKKEAIKIMDENFKLNTEIYKLKHEKIKLDNENTNLKKENKKIRNENFILNDELLTISKNLKN
jgi:transcriptional regulator with XRE-family HTH domain